MNPVVFDAKLRHKEKTQMLLNLWWTSVVVILCLGTVARADEKEKLRKIIDSVLEESRRDYSVMPFDSLKRFADKGVAEAQYYVGFRYFDGSAGVRDSAEGLKWIRKSAAGGDPYAPEILGILFNSGSLVPANSDSAAYWIQRAAELDNGVCQARMADYRWHTARTADDSITGYMWSGLAIFNLFAENDRKAGDSLKSYYASHLTPEQIAQGDSKVISFMERQYRGAKNGRDSTRVIRNLSKAGWPEGMFRVATMDHLFEDASDSSMRKGMALMAKAANAGYGYAAFVIGDKYNWGLKPVTGNLDSAVYWLKMGVELGDAYAQSSLGYMYTVGRGVKKDSKEGVRLLKLSVAQNNRVGICELGNFYWSDNAPKKNKVRAWALLTLAKDRSMQVSIVKIGEIIRKMNDKERAEAEQLYKDLGDAAKIRGVIEGWLN